MKAEDFLIAVERLTGTERKGIGDPDTRSLAAILADDDRAIDCSQFNELLLLANKDRVQAPFFNFFFTPKCKVGSIRVGVERFQKAAMLLFGNFIFAYRRLSRIKDEIHFLAELREVGKKTRVIVGQLTKRRPKLVEIERINRADTPLVGYLLAPRIVADGERCRLTLRALDSLSSRLDWKDLVKKVRVLAKRSADFRGMGPAGPDPWF